MVIFTIFLSVQNKRTFNFLRKPYCPLCNDAFKFSKIFVKIFCLTDEKEWKRLIIETCKIVEAARNGKENTLKKKKSW